MADTESYYRLEEPASKSRAVKTARSMKTEADTGSYYTLEEPVSKSRAVKTARSTNTEAATGSYYRPRGANKQVPDGKKRPEERHSGCHGKLLLPKRSQ